MSSTAKPADRLLEHFIPVMERQGYVYRKSNHRFLKTFPCGTYEFSLMFDGRGGLVGVSPFLGVHFDALEKRFQKVLGYDCLWSAGATLLNAGANPWNFWLNEDRFAAMTPVERSAFASDVIHPPSRIQACVQFLTQAHEQFAVPLFQKLQTYQDLAEFYGEYRRNGFVGRCRPRPENVVSLSLLIAAHLGEDLEEIVASAKGATGTFGGLNVDSMVRNVRKYIETTGSRNLVP